MQDKKIILYIVPTHIGIKTSEEVDRAVKQAIGMPGMTTRLLQNTTWLWGELESTNDKGSEKTALSN